MTKPVQHEVIRLEGSTIGAIMCDDKGYFYRPKRTSITKGKHDPKKDGQHFPTIKELKLTLY